MIKLSVANDYSKRTGLRYSSISDYSGEDFYHAILNAQFKKAYETGDKLELSFDGTEDGCGPSFIDESVGNLVYDFSLDVVKKHLLIISDDMPMWLDMINDETFPQWEDRRKNGPSPKITEEHHAWYRLSNGNLENKIWISQITPKNEL